VSSHHTTITQAHISHITWGLGSYFACLAYDRLTGNEDSPVTVKRRAQQLRETLTELGPSFIKAGQVLANRPDIVREDYMNELCILQVRWGHVDWVEKMLGGGGKKRGAEECGDGCGQAVGCGGKVADELGLCAAEGGRGAALWLGRGH
jgi:hypothetical protein